MKTYCPKSCGACARDTTGAAGKVTEDYRNENPIQFDDIPKLLLSSDDNIACGDNHVHCDAWAQRGECDKNPAYMLTKCRKACKACVVPTNPLPAPGLNSLNLDLQKYKMRRGRNNIMQRVKGKQSRKEL